MTPPKLLPSDFGFRPVATKPKKPRASSKPKGIDPTVENFLHVLSSKMTQWDIQLSKFEERRGHANIYRLGLLLEAVSKVRDSIPASMMQDSSPAAMAVLKQAIEREFTVTRQRDAVLRQIDNYLQTGKRPTLLK